MREPFQGQRLGAAFHARLATSFQARCGKCRYHVEAPATPGYAAAGGFVHNAPPRVLAEGGLAEPGAAYLELDGVSYRAMASKRFSTFAQSRLRKNASM